MNSISKPITLIVIGVIFLGIVAISLLPIGSLGAGDLLPYWSAAHVLSQNGDPYDPVALQHLEHVVAPGGGQVDPAWNPPWLLVVLLPLGVLPFAAAARVWLVLNLLILGALPLIVWCSYTDRNKRQPPVWLLICGLGFAAALTTIAIGQIVTLVLLGLVLCVLSLQARRDGWAGAALLLLLIKPQLVYLVLPTVLIWTALQRRWRVWWGLILTGVISLGVVTILSPEWLTGYLQLVGPYDFLQHSAATIGGFVQGYWSIRLLRFMGVLTVVFIPRLIRLINERGLWTGVNVALLISLPLAPYGWSFDQVVLIPAIVQAIFWWRLFDKRRQRRYWLSLIGIYLVALFIKLSGLGDFWFVWIGLAIGGLYAAVYVERGREQHFVAAG